jgi:porin
MPMVDRVLRFAATLAATAVCSPAALAPAQGLSGAPAESLSTNLPEPFTSLDGLRPMLAARGVRLEMDYIGDAIGVGTGGVKQGLPYAGRVEAILEADLEKTLGLRGLGFHIDAYQIHGNGPSEQGNRVKK